MLEQTFLDAVVVIALFVLRVGVPLALLFGIAAWLERKLRPTETQASQEPARRARVIPFVKPHAPAKPTAAEQSAEASQRAHNR